MPPCVWMLPIASLPPPEVSMRPVATSGFAPVLTVPADTVRAAVLSAPLVSVDAALLTTRFAVARGLDDEREPPLRVRLPVASAVVAVTVPEGIVTVPKLCVPGAAASDHGPFPVNVIVPAFARLPAALLPIVKPPVPTETVPPDVTLRRPVPIATPPVVSIFAPTERAPFPSSVTPPVAFTLVPSSVEAPFATWTVPKSWRPVLSDQVPAPRNASVSPFMLRVPPVTWIPFTEIVGDPATTVPPWTMTFPKLTAPFHGPPLVKITFPLFPNVPVPAWRPPEPTTRAELAPPFTIVRAPPPDPPFVLSKPPTVRDVLPPPTESEAESSRRLPVTVMFVLTVTTPL